MTRRPILVARSFLIAMALLQAPPSAQAQNTHAYFNAIYQSYNIMDPTLRNKMREIQDGMRAKEGSQANAGSNGAANSSVANGNANSIAATIAAAAFTPVVEERDKVIDSLVAGLPESMGRANQKARIQTLNLAVEKSAGAYKNNIAQITYLLIGVSLHNLTGRPMETARAQETIRSIAAAFASNQNFQRMDNRQRSQLYYLLESTISLQEGLVLSKDPNEVQAGKTLAQVMLRELGVQP